MFSSPVRRSSISATHKPWLQRPDWAAREVVDHESLAVVVFMAVWCVGWWGCLALQWAVGGDQIATLVKQGWQDAAMYGVLLLGGLAGLLVLGHALLDWLQYGRASLAIETLPGYLGERFRGRVRVRLKHVLVEPVEVTLGCESVLALWRRGAFGRRVMEQDFNELWTETLLVESDDLRVTGREISIPIDFGLPDHEPACKLDEKGSGIRWLLSVRGTHAQGQAFRFTFELPVFRR
jgi:hypothetical protein